MRFNFSLSIQKLQYWVSITQFTRTPSLTRSTIENRVNEKIHSLEIRLTEKINSLETRTHVLVIEKENHVIEKISQKLDSRFNGNPKE